MTAAPPGQEDARPSRRARRLTLVVAVVAILGLITLGALVWYIFFRPAGPPPIGTDAPVIPEGWLAGPSILAIVTSFAA
jgi:hypothetical protein